MSHPTDRKLKDFKVLVFDVYGTLIDWETGIYEALKPLLLKSPIASKWSRKEALEAYQSVESDLQAQFPKMLYSELLAKVHEVLSARLTAAAGKPVESSTLDGTRSGEYAPESGPSTSDAPDPATIDDPHKKFADSIKNWPIFPDTRDALRTLGKHYKLVVLSNVDRQSFSSSHARLSSRETSPTVEEDKLYAYPSPPPEKYWFPRLTSGSDSPFTLILTAQDNGVYKPSPDAFRATLDCIGSQKELLGSTSNAKPTEDVLVVAQSLFHDHVPANALGLHSVWISRSGASMGVGTGTEGVKYNWKFNTLGELAQAVDNE